MFDFTPPDPLHPAVVHLPLALALLMPVMAIVIGFAIWQRWFPRRTWLLVVLFQAILVGSGWYAMQTGEAEEKIVEAVVGHDPIHEHEEAAELFVYIAAGVFALALVTLLFGASKKFGAWGSGLTVLGTIAVALFAMNAGKLGGKLVYEHNAGAAYVDGPSAPAPAEPSEPDD